MTINPSGFRQPRGSRAIDSPPEHHFAEASLPSGHGSLPAASPRQAVPGSGEAHQPAVTITWRGPDDAGGVVNIAEDGQSDIKLFPAGRVSSGWLNNAPVGEFRVALAIAGATRVPLGENQPAVDLYLDLMKKCLTRIVFKESGPPIDPDTPVFDPAAREEGRDWPADAETMAGRHRLDNVQMCVTDVLQRGVPGDLIETGVWRGGTTIFMRAILKAYGDHQRRVWVADSFAGLPHPDIVNYPQDQGLDLWQFEQLAVPIEQVQANFARYGLLDDQVQFLKGWFRDTLPDAPIDRLAVARLDGDLYESTMDALQALYPKLSVGGYLIVDDYGAIPACSQAVTDYRATHHISEPIVPIDWTGVYWRRER